MTGGTITQLIHRWYEGHHWKWKVLALCVLLNLFIAPPRLDLLWSRMAKEKAQQQGKELDEVDYWDLLDIKIASPFANLSTEFHGNENFAKRTFRIVPCLAAHLLHLGKPGFFLLQFAVGCAQIALLLGWFFRLTSDRLKSALLTLIVTTTYFGQAAFFDTNGWGDAFAYFFLTWAITTTRAWCCFLAVFLAGFTDERALPPALFAILAHLPRADGTSGMGSKQFILQCLRLPFTWAVLGGWAACLSSRFVLSHAMDYSQPYGLIGLPVLSRFETLHHFMPSLFLTLKLLLIPLLVFLAAGIMRRSMPPLALAASLVGILTSILLAFAVLDHTRSLAYLGPACLFGVYFIWQHEDLRRHFTTPALAVALLAHVLCPTASIVFDLDDGKTRVHDVEFLRPLPVELVWLVDKLATKF